MNKVTEDKRNVQRTTEEVYNEGGRADRDGGVGKKSSQQRRKFVRHIGLPPCRFFREYSRGAKSTGEEREKRHAGENRRRRG